ncbi:MAG: glyoxylase-like metal-dependent hydrolase (beta-lactamase superfamily II) [Natronomonas sp.]|jgi:glyoxylase-like metal-dependent hydrolase (beta-lactamase superfamily II)|uniref:MBL fold metallo-hydrolase n=1 Tax=Natronomonas sp. TaxID=2184060 RepID=UPI00398965CC
MPRRVADGVHLLDVGWPEPVGSNAYVVDDGDVTLVDTGLPIPRRSLSGELRAAGFETADIDRVLLTHYDIDHVGGLGRLDVDVPVYLGAADAELVRRSWSPPWRHHKGAFHRLVRRLFSLSSVDLRPVEDGDEIGGFRAVHTPGHNPGHTVFLHEGSETALLGDLVWESDRQFVSPPWLDSYDKEEIATSIGRVAEESFEHACVGHGTPLSPAADATLRALAAEL